MAIQQTREYTCAEHFLKLLTLLPFDILDFVSM